MNPATSPHKTRVDPETRKEIRHRLLRIAGQVQGLQRMLDEDRYCVDVLIQVEAAREGLRQVGRLLLRSHLETCVTDAVRRGDGPAAYDELIAILYKFCR
ncbi:metal-sensitive transcriptional regulator [Caldinitratiruptor microaerophilus]|uniref:metal-sensitive transcriptional regulator n=1 Tax=Caldinitratiruptor microaerophilus TaxID=671077 RepID=UPI00222FE517|nr:metal-sensitive transcriptional regulator [Caldinitratiruptor microaerophilus]